MNSTIGAALSLGFVLGLRHALDPDHLVAVSTIVSEHKSVLRSSLVGTFWGLGHTASLLALGINATWRAMRERGWQIHTHTHHHEDGAPHTHIHLHTNDEHAHHHRLFR